MYASFSYFYPLCLVFLQLKSSLGSNEPQTRTVEGQLGSRGSESTTNNYSSTMEPTTSSESFSFENAVHGVYEDKSNRRQEWRRRGKHKSYLKKILTTPERWIYNTFKWHNKFRKLHGAKPLKLDFKLCYEAEQDALRTAEESDINGQHVLQKLSHLKPGEKNWESRANAGSRIDQFELPGSHFIQKWYKEIEDHDWNSHSIQPKSGNFTQIIWRATRRVGCGRAMSQHAVLFIKCHYYPAGNDGDEEEIIHNVHPPVDGKLNSVPDFENM